MTEPSLAYAHGASEVLVLGAMSAEDGVVLLRPDWAVEDGSDVA